MRKIFCMLFLVCCALFFAACSRSDEDGFSVFEAETLEIYEGGLLVKPVKGSRELKSADQISVSNFKLQNK